MTTKTLPQWRLDRINPTPYMRPGRSEYSAFHENWMKRMAESKTRVEVHLSTDPSEEAWQSWELTGEPQAVFQRVKKHMEFRRAQRTLAPGRYCIRVPGHELKHSFEVA